MTQNLYTDEAVGANERYILNGLVIFSPTVWDNRPEVYSDWRAIRFNDEERQREVISLLESSRELFLCPRFILQDTVFIPFNGLRVLHGIWSKSDRKKEEVVKVRYHKHIVDPQVIEYLSRKPGSQGWYKTKRIGKSSVSTICMEFAPLKNVIAIAAKLKGIKSSA